MMMGGGLLVLVVLVALAVYFAQGGSGTRAPQERRPGAREILEERFARGEISEEEFDERKRTLERASA